MDWKSLQTEYSKLQNIYGEPSLDSIISGGKFQNPNICFVFMNPTGRNIAASKTWTDIKSPWIGTKNIWDMFFKLNMLNQQLYLEVKKRKPLEWSYDFANTVYDDVKKNGIYITNLAKCTQTDAKPLPDRIFKEYLELLNKELELVKPNRIVVLGNQVSSIFLNTKISVSKDRKKIFYKNNIPVLPVYYPVGQGRRNMDLAVEDIEWFMNN